MSDDYLWDRNGPPDPEVARLEALLRPFGQQEPAPAPPVSLKPDVTESSRPAHIRSRRVLVPLAVAAMVAMVIGGWWLVNRSRPKTPGWVVTRLEGAPTIASQRMGDRNELPVGEWLETNGQAKASISVATLGRVDVEPLTRLRLVGTRAGDHRLELARGTLHATIWAPPGQFFVETPSSTAVDLGCAYTLTIDEEGAGLVTVLLGWVGFEWRERESFIPAGSVCATRPGVGPGTPYHKDTSPAVRAALETIDFSIGSPDVSTALGRVLAEAGERDEVMLWHLLTRVPVGGRDRVFDRLADFVPPPAGVTREGIRAGRRDMLDRWWDALGLGTVSLWRTWKQQWQDNTPNK